MKRKKISTNMLLERNGVISFEIRQKERLKCVTEILMQGLVLI